MFDYYRARFKVLSKPRRAIPRTTGVATSGPSMPISVQRSFWLGWFLSVVFLSAAISVSDAPAGAQAFTSILHASFLLLPFSIILAAGLNERQRWTRPFLAIQLLLCGGAFADALFAGGMRAKSVAVIFVAGALSLSLYRSGASRSYFACLRTERLTTFSREDARVFMLLPLATTLIGIGVGGFVCGSFVSRYLAESPSPGAMGPNDLVAVVLAGAVGASAFGVAGKMLGEVLADRWDRAA